MRKKKTRIQLEDVSGTKPYWSYLENLRLRKQSPNTIKMIVFHMKHLALFLRKNQKELRDMTTDDLYRFRQSLEKHGLAPQTVAGSLRHLRSFFRWLSETGEIFLDPYVGVKLPCPPRPLLRAPTEKEMRKLLAQPDISDKTGVRDRAIIELAYSTAIRLDELTRLSVTDPDLEKGMLRVFGKGSKERIVPLGRQAIYWLKNYIREARPKLLKGKLDCARLWLGYRDGKPMEDSAIRAMIGHYSGCAGLGRISPHAIRRACATHMLQNGAHPVQIQLLLGHAKLQTLSHYLRLTITDIKRTHARSNPGR